MGVWLMPQPQTYMPFWVRVWKEADLGPLVDTLRKLLLDRTIEGVPSLYNTICLGSVLSSRSQWYTGEGPIPDDVIDRIARELEIGRWIIRSALWGDDAVVEHSFAKIKAAFEQIPGAEVWATKHDPETASTLEHPADLIQAGVPNLGWNKMTAWYGGEEGGHIGFSPIAPLTGGDAIALRDLLRGLIEERAGLDYIAANLAVSARSFAHVTLIIFDTKNEPQARRAYDTARLLVEEAAKQGYGEYRAHLDFMDVAAEQYSFNDHAYRRFTETIKDALDPSGILSPGKQGIWPKSMRNGR
jgi:4-cresol dehydrogenase (hydroxylating)